MADVFVSYARSDKARVAPLVAAIEAKGWSVWWDPEITPGQEFDDQIDAEIDAAKAVLVVWTPVSVASRWVRGEAREAAERGILVPVRFEQARLPMDVRAIHTTDLDGWSEDPASAPAQECLRALGAMIARAQASRSAKTGSASALLGKGFRALLDLRAALRQHERRSRAGVFQRRHHRRHHHRSEQGLGAGGHLAQQRLPVQGQACRHPEGRARAEGQPRAGGQRAQGRRARAHQRAVDRRRQQQPCLGRALRPRRQRHLRDCRTKFPRPSSRR